MAIWSVMHSGVMIRKCNVEAIVITGSVYAMIPRDRAKLQQCELWFHRHLRNPFH